MEMTKKNIKVAILMPSGPHIASQVAHFHSFDNVRQELVQIWDQVYFFGVAILCWNIGE